MLDKAYDPAGIEEKWYTFWLEKGYFHAEVKTQKPSFSIVIPPPNVTGSLHMGHALNATLQDIIIRWKKMSSYNALWVPGTDHAGIATQNVVEKQLASENMDRHKLGRSLFIKRVWQWKEEHGGQIIHQLKKLGAACDWERERFTLDEGLSEAVKEVFVRLYEEGLIYRGDYIINWCPRCHTALSDLEVEHEEKDDKIYHIKYPFANEEGYVVVATTRPETMLGDTAVAVHPDDERYSAVRGKMVRLPIVNRLIPVISDSYVDPHFGTGAVKVTPAHDPNDFEIGLRHDLKAITIMNTDGNMSKEAGPYEGQDRFLCRKNLINDLKAQGLLISVKDHKLSVGTCYRCKEIVEPYLSKQWFVKVKPLASEAIKAVEQGQIRIIPESWNNSYFDWMNNIKDWCISRQIWWGHQIPAWYCDECGSIIVARQEPGSCSSCSNTNLRQDEDVLDTWFSSALWPFSTLGWPTAQQNSHSHQMTELDVFYPTSVLITGFDILFFWVARMIMMGLKFMKKPPFRDVYIHALVRDAQGQKMSKSKGNVIDPLLMTEKYGTDAFRFTLTAFAAQGRDIKFDESRVEGYRHFINKIWNAARFILINLDNAHHVPFIKNKVYLSLADQWILSRLSHVIADVNLSLEEYRFNDAASTLYQFIWHEFCDWYLEMAKPALFQTKGPQKEAALSTLVHTLEVTLRLLHPFMPFITEELWQHIPHEGESIYSKEYPRIDDGIVDNEAEQNMQFIMDSITTIRNIRGELNIPPSLDINVLIRAADTYKELLLDNVTYIKTLSKTGNLTIGEDVTKPKGAAFASVGAIEVYVPLEGLFDIDQEVKRLQKELLKKEGSLNTIKRKFANESFMTKAPEEVVVKERTKYKTLLGNIKKYKENINRLEELKK
jgi:valyl-tRNA synthetase